MQILSLKMINLKGQTVILASSAIETDFREYLYLLRSKNIRVIVLLKNEKEEKYKNSLRKWDI